MVKEWIFTEDVCYEEIFFAIVGEDISSKVLPGRIWHVSWKLRVNCLFCLMLATDLAMINIIGDVCIYSGPVNNCLGQASYFLYSSVIGLKVTECHLIQLRGYAHSVPL